MVVTKQKSFGGERALPQLVAERPDVGHGEAKRIPRAEPGDAASPRLPGRKGEEMQPCG